MTVSQFPYGVAGGIDETYNPDLTDTTSYLTATAQTLFIELEAIRQKIVAQLPDQGFVADYQYERDLLGRIITDHLGSVRGVIDTTDGTLKQAIDYDAWGKVTRDTNPGWGRADL